MKQKPTLLFAGLLAAAFLTPSLIAATTVVNETFSDGERATQSPPGSLAWYYSGDPANSSVAGGFFTFQSGTGTSGGRQAVAYFPSTTLAVGEKLTLSFNLKVAAPFKSVGTGLRVGLFNSSGNRDLQAENYPNSTKLVGYTGYAAFANPAADSSNGTTLQIRKRTGTFELMSGSNASNTGFATQIGVSGGPAGGVPESAFADGTTYTGQIELTRTAADAMTITVSYSGGTLAGYTLTVDDASGIETTFDTLAFAIAVAQGTPAMQTLSVGAISLTVDTAAPAGTAPAITTQPQSQIVAAGASATLSVVATGDPAPTYQWKKDGSAIAGATLASLTIAAVAQTDVGSYTVDVTNASGTVTSDVATIAIATAADPGRVLNFSIRATAGTGAQIPIIGFVLGGSGTKPLLVRSVGPTLAGYGVTTGFLADPQLALYAGSNAVASNDNWAGDATVTSVGAEVGALALASAASKDAALYLPTVAAGLYTVQTSGVASTTGITLAEVYDGAPGTAGTAKLMNVSGRAQVGAGDNVVIAGFVIGGTTPVRVLIRGVGPGLTGQGVTGALPDPTLHVFQSVNGTSTEVASNDNWGGGATLATAFSTVGAFSLANDSKDAALLMDFNPGVYTAVLGTADTNTGVGLVEFYVIEQAP